MEDTRFSVRPGNGRAIGKALDLTHHGPIRIMRARLLRRIRLEAQDIALSRRRHGFESRIRYQPQLAPETRFPGRFFVSGPIGLWMI